MTNFQFILTRLFVLVFVLLMTSCSLFDPCADVVCENGGMCNEGDCACAEGYEGESCATYIPVQKRLDNGSRPLELVQKGVPLDSLYGKTYEGGLIFFVNSEPAQYPKFSGEGLVTTSTDYGNFHQWGCRGVETGASGREVGEGKANTDKVIAANCTDEARSFKLVDELILNGFDDWFMPSIDEVQLIYDNLHAKGHSNFLGNIRRYQSSTEIDSFHFALKPFYKDTVYTMVKFSGDDIRPVREF
ncbi:MAG: hypothetical protein AAF587_42565 [Bacteroidota bacterium]